MKSELPVTSKISAHMRRKLDLRDQLIAECLAKGEPSYEWRKPNGYEKQHQFCMSCGRLKKFHTSVLKRATMAACIPTSSSVQSAGSAVPNDVP